MYSAEWKCPLERHRDRRFKGCGLLHSSQPMVPPFLAYASTRDNDKHWPGLFSVSHSVLQKFPESWEGFPSAGSHEELRKSLLALDGTWGKDFPGPVVDGRGAGRRVTHSFPWLGTSVSMAVQLQVLSKFFSLLQPSSVPPQLWAFLPSPAHVQFI